MTNNQDARPFVDLKKDAQEFRMKFDEDITECLSFLDAKITALICEPDSFGTSGRSVQQNALAEFSKAKYDIFISVKSLINSKEREWLDYIAEMKKLFIENVEIFLAGTKLEVKLPPSESVPSYSSRKSPGNRKSNSTSVTSSIYPILSSITKNIPVLGTSFQEKDSPSAISKANVGETSQFNRRGRLSTSSIKLANSLYEEEMDFEEPESDILDRSRSHSSFNTKSRKSSNSGLNTSRSSSGRRSSLKKDMELGLNEKSVSTLEKHDAIDVPEPVNANSLSSNMRGRRGKLAKKSSYIDNRSNETVVLSQTDIDVTAPENANNLPSKGRGRRGKFTEVNPNIENVIAQSNSSSNDENEVQLTETIVKEAPVRGRKGRSAPKAKATDLKVAAQKSISSTDESEGQATEIVENNVPVKGRRGRLPTKAKTNDLTVAAQKNNCSTDESEGQATEIIENEVPLKGRRGRLPPKTKANDSTDQNITQRAVGRGRKAIKPAIEEDIYEPDQNITQRAVGRGRKAIKPAIQEDIYEPGPSKSPKKVSFGGDHSSSDELDIQTPLARPVKSAARRKTLLPNLEDISGADIIPGNPSRSKAKRKTIGGVSELETVAPSKRLKVGQKAISSQEEDSANDNLLESDGNYSEWMTLKSVDGKIPTRPAIYEVKVWRAKKPAYIGSCENLRQKLTFYNLKQNSGHKHLDKFIDRNHSEIQVRFEVVPSFDDAKREAKKRLDNFKAQHKNTPAYN